MDNAIRRKRGRPREFAPAEPRSMVATWVTAREHDRLCQIARRRGVSVSSLLRRVVVLRLTHDDDDVPAL